MPDIGRTDDGTGSTTLTLLILPSPLLLASIPPVLVTVPAIPAIPALRQRRQRLHGE